MEEKIEIEGMPFHILLNNQQITKAIQDLAQAINTDFEGQELRIVVILKGAFVFASELIRHINIPFQMDFLQINSYYGERRGELKLGSEPLKDLTNSRVLVLEDIVDSGATTDFLANYMEEQSVLDLKIASLLFKPNNYKGIKKPDYVAFNIDNEFVVGYGLDYNQNARGLLHIYQKTV